MICLASGSYSGFTLSGVSKSSDVTVQPAPGANVTVGFVELDADSHVRFTGLGGSMTMQGGDIDSGASSCSSHLTLDHIVYSSGFNVVARCTNMNVLLDSDRFDNLGTNTWEGRLNVVDGGSNVPATASVGVTISNSHFGGGCSDGIQIVGTPGVQVGPGNEFTGIQQSGCDPVHADPIQGVTAPGTLIIGNYIHDNGDGSGALMFGSTAGINENVQVQDNVFVCTCLYPYSIYTVGAQNWLIQHNTFAGGGSVGFISDNGGNTGPTSNNTVRDNVFQGSGGIAPDSGSSNYGTNDHNLNSLQSGIGDITGTPVFVGGAKPTSYAGYPLAAGSPGKGAASDGTDMGISP